MNMEKSFKIKSLRVFKSVVSIVAAIAIFYEIVQVLNYMYVDPGASSKERVVWHDFYEEKGQINNLYLGASHVYDDINPMLLDAMNGQSNFNLSTSGQLPNGTFHFLREADRYNELSHVYVELYYYYYVKYDMVSGDERIYDEFFRTWQNSDYMKLSLNKLVYMFSIARPEQYVDLCIPFTRYRTKLGDWNYIQQTIDQKQQEEYINYQWHSGTEEYTRKGFFSANWTYDDCNKIYRQTDVLGDDPIGETSEKYLCKTIEYCQKREIPITLFVAPIYELQLIATEHYDNYIDQVRAIAERYNVEFYDFNLAKEEYLPIQNSEYFRDIGHLNDSGADMFTAFFCEVVSGNEVNNNQYFYDSYAEKLQNTTPQVYGIYFQTPAEEDTVRNYWVASNRKSEMEYRIEISPEEGEEYTVQDFDENKHFALPRGETGICAITARMKEAPDNVHTLEINF